MKISEILYDAAKYPFSEKPKTLKGMGLKYCMQIQIDSLLHQKMILIFNALYRTIANKKRQINCYSNTNIKIIVKISNKPVKVIINVIVPIYQMIKTRKFFNAFQKRAINRSGFHSPYII